MAGKARVHELAKELGVESKTVLAKLQELGEYVKSASSTVEAPVARRLRASFQAGSAAPSAASSQPPVRSAQPGPPRADGKVAPAPPRTSARLERNVIVGQRCLVRQRIPEHRRHG